MTIETVADEAEKLFSAIRSYQNNGNDNLDTQKLVMMIDDLVQEIHEIIEREELN
jgi:hypothetical protein